MREIIRASKVSAAQRSFAWRCEAMYRARRERLAQVRAASTIPAARSCVVSQRLASDRLLQSLAGENSVRTRWICRQQFVVELAGGTLAAGAFEDTGRCEN